VSEAVVRGSRGGVGLRGNMARGDLFRSHPRLAGSAAMPLWMSVAAIPRARLGHERGAVGHGDCD